jgi:hypothetical protein
MKHTLLNQDMAVRQARRNLRALAAVHDPARIQGGNWTMQRFRRSGPAYDETECQISIAEFMADAQERHASKNNAGAAVRCAAPHERDSRASAVRWALRGTHEHIFTTQNVHS